MCKNDKWGFIDSTNTIKIDFEYDYTTAFNSYGYAPVMKGDKWGIIDTNNNVIIPFEYEIVPGDGMPFKFFNSELLHTSQLVDQLNIMGGSISHVINLSTGEIVPEFENRGWIFNFMSGYALEQNPDDYSEINIIDENGAIVVSSDALKGLGFRMNSLINGEGNLGEGRFAVLHTDNSYYIIKVEKKSDDPDFPFADIKEDDWFYDDVIYVYENELFKGTSENQFSPNAPMTRGMLVTVLHRLAGEPDAETSSFSDVPNDAYYAKPIAWAAELGIVNGVGDSSFDPEANITRQDIAVILARFAEKIGITLPKITAEITFSDADEISDYAIDAVQKIQQAGIINGKPGNIFDPKGHGTRAEVATMLSRFIEAVS